MDALVIRTLYNNQGWRDPCKQPYNDPLCYYCLGNKLRLNINPPSPGCNSCDGSCWEQTLCSQYFWGCTPQGKLWGKGRTWPGMKVFFVFRERNSPRLYTLWGKTTISRIDTSINTSGQRGMSGYHLMHFAPFSPAPRNRWVQHLTSNAVVGGFWGQGNYRYIPDKIATVLNSYPLYINNPVNL